MKEAVFCTAPSLVQAEYVVEQLQHAGFAPNDISVLTSDQRSDRDFAHQKNTKAPEGATAGGVAGGVLGGALGLLAGIGAIAIPGLGPFIAAGPIMATLAGASVGGAAGGLVGALAGAGLPEFEAKRYEGLVRQGNVLISCHCESRELKKRAKDAMKGAGANDVSASGEGAVSQKKAG